MAYSAIARMTVHTLGTCDYEGDKSKDLGERDHRSDSFLMNAMLL